MEARAWRLAAGATATLLALLALVGWRSGQLDGGWLLALRTTALLAVAGLLGTVLIAGRTALRPPSRREVVVRLPAEGEPFTEVQGVGGGRPDRLPAALLLAVLSAAPVLVVLALAAPGQGGVDPVVGGSGPATDGAAGTAGPAAPSTPTTDRATPSTSEAPVRSEPSEPSEPSEAAGTAAPVPPGTPADDVAAAPLPAGCEVVVASGDSLWALAAAHLGPGATAAEVRERWQGVYAANRDVVGPDPNLLQPGQVLRTCG